MGEKQGRERLRHRCRRRPEAQEDLVVLEAVLPALAERVYPRCVGGRRAGPPEDCGGPGRFLELAQYWSWQAPVRVAEILGELMQAPDSVLSEHREALEAVGGVLRRRRWSPW